MMHLPLWARPHAKPILGPHLILASGSSLQSPEIGALLDQVPEVSAAGHVAALDAVRAAVEDLTARLKADGLPPERVLVAVKVAAGAQRRGLAGASTDSREALVADVVRWLGNHE